MSNLQSALAYGKAGLFVFPILEGTKDQPLIKQWGVRASKDAAQIAAWWKRWPEANIGLACMRSGIGVVDSDVPNGEATLQAIADKMEGELSPTKSSRTPRGGRHRFYKGRLATTAGKIGLNVDTRGVGSGNGGYVLLPPSRTDKGSYTWEDQRPMATLDQWVADRCAAAAAADTGPADQTPLVEWDLPRNIERAREYLTKDAPVSKQGAGGDELIVKRVVPTLKDMAISEELAAELMAELWNQRCEPPWQLGDCDPKDNLYVKVHNGYVYCVQNTPGINTPEADFAKEATEEAKVEEDALTKMIEEWRVRDQTQRAATWDHTDFLLYLPGPDKIKFIFTATGSEEYWSTTAVNLKCKAQPVLDKRKVGKTKSECQLIDGTEDQWLRKVDKETGKPILGKDGKPVIAFQSAADWIKNTPDQHVAVTTWWPGKPVVIRNTLVIKEGGVIPKYGMHSFNRYIAPQLSATKPGDPKRWLDHLKLIYPDDWEHILYWLAWRVQHPEKKIMHALVLGGATRIGKDMLLKPVVYAIGPWNFGSTNAQTIMDEPKFTPYLESVICLIHEAKDFGDQDRYAFYHRIKPWLGGEARGVLMSADKNVKVHAIIDVWAAIITTNFKLRGLYIPPDDARIYFAWSKRTRADWAAEPYKISDANLDRDYFKPLQHWYENEGGFEAVAHYLRTLDLTKSDFSPTAPPPKTEAWHEVVAAGRDHAETALGRIIEGLGNPAAVTVNEVRAADEDGELDWWSPKGRNQVAPQMEAAGYVRVLNTGNKTGRWMAGPSDRRIEIYIYGQAKLSPAERRKAALEVFDREAVKAKKPPGPEAA